MTLEGGIALSPAPVIARSDHDPIESVRRSNLPMSLRGALNQAVCDEAIP